MKRIARPTVQSRVQRILFAAHAGTKQVAGVHNLTELLIFFLFWSFSSVTAQAETTTLCMLTPFVILPAMTPGDEHHDLQEGIITNSKRDPDQ